MTTTNMTDNRAVKNETSEASVGTLLKDLADESRTLISKEVELVKVEMSEKVNKATDALTSIAMGAGVLFAGLIVLLFALSEAMTAWFAEFMDPQVAIWLGPLVLALVLAVIGYSMISGAKKKLRETSLKPEKAELEARRTTEWAKEKVSNG